MLRFQVQLTAQPNEVVPKCYHSATFALLQQVTLQYIPTNLKSLSNRLLVCARSGPNRQTTVYTHSTKMGNLKLQGMELKANQELYSKTEGCYFTRYLTNVGSVYDILPHSCDKNDFYLAAAEGGLFYFELDLGKFIHITYERISK